MIRLPHDRVEEWQSNNCDEISGGNHRRRAQSHGKHSSLRIAVERMELPFPSRTCQLFVFICCVRARVFSVPRSHATLTLFREREPIGVDGPDNVEILGPFPELVASDIAHAFPLCALCALSVLCRRLRLSRRRATSLFAQYPRTPSLLFAKRPTPPPPMRNARHSPLFFQCVRARVSGSIYERLVERNSFDYLTRGGKKNLQKLDNTIVQRRNAPGPLFLVITR